MSGERQPEPGQQEFDFDLDAEDNVIQFRDDELDEDDLYDLKREFVDVGAIEIASRVDIEYLNSLRYEDYWAKFQTGNVVAMLMTLGNVQYQHMARGNRRRSDIVRDLSSVLSDALREWADEHDVDLQEYLGFAPGPDSVERDHSEGRQRAKHTDTDDERDHEEIGASVQQGELDEALNTDIDDVFDDVGDDALDEMMPDAIDEKEIRPYPQTPDEPESPDGPGQRDDDDPEGA